MLMFYMGVTLGKTDISLRWSWVAKQPGVRLEWGSPRGPETKLTNLLAFGAIMSKVVLNRKLASSQLESPPSRWRTNGYTVKVVRSITYFCRRADDVCLSLGRDQKIKKRGDPHALVRCDS